MKCMQYKVQWWQTGRRDQLWLCELRKTGGPLQAGRSKENAQRHETGQGQLTKVLYAIVRSFELHLILNH